VRQHDKLQFCAYYHIFLIIQKNPAVVKAYVFLFFREKSLCPAQKTPKEVIFLKILGFSPCQNAKIKL